MADAQRIVSRFLRQKGVGQRAQLVEQVLFIRQHIDTGRHRSKDTHKVGRHAADAVHDLRHGGGRQAVHFLDHGLRIVQHFDSLLQVDAVAVLHHDQQILHALYVAGEVRKQHDDTVQDLRDDQPCQQHDQQDRYGIGHQNSNAACLVFLLEQLMVKEFYHGIQDVGNDHAARKRRQNPNKEADFAQEIPEVV